MPILIVFPMRPLGIYQGGVKSISKPHPGTALEIIGSISRTQGHGQGTYGIFAWLLRLKLVRGIRAITAQIDVGQCAQPRNLSQGQIPHHQGKRSGQIPVVSRGWRRGLPWDLQLKGVSKARHEREEAKCLWTPYTHLFQRFSQLLLIQPTTNMKGSLNRRDNNSSNDTRRCW